MQKIILPAPKNIHPFNEPARDLRIQNKPLWLIHRDVLAPYANRERELLPGEALPDFREPAIVYRENLFFDAAFIEAFLGEAKNRARPSRAALSENDLAFREHALPLSHSYQKYEDLYLVDLWYYPNGYAEDVQPLVIDMLPSEVGYYHVPTYMANESGDLTFQVPLRSILAIDTWTHIFIADVVFGLFSRGARFEDRLERNPLFKLKILATAMYEGTQVLESSSVVKIGRNCVIDPTAIIHGPTTIGDNVTIGAGAVIENCIIGDNVNVSQGCQVMLSVVGDGAFLPFRSSMFMTTFMDNSMVAQNTCLQMCVIGRNTFIGAGSTFTDFNLIPTPLKAVDSDGNLTDANRPVLGGCVGHNCRLGSGMIFFPARTIESDVVLVASPERRIISKNLRYEDSDHHRFGFAELHKRLYPRPGEKEHETW
ncbi:MAG: multidrug transporter [Anaerolineales bacterium]|nr:multidrug transporter [Chloroflexota bacterium]MBL6982888.1 multidrug transporter [Anaerolineales bacterium]